MAIEGEAREAKAKGGDSGARNEDAGATAPRVSRTRIVLGSLAGLLILAGAIYYFGGQRSGTEVAAGSGSDRPAEGVAVANRPPAPDSSEKSVSSTTSSQEPPSAKPQTPQQSEPQQSANASSPPAATPAETPATTAPGLATSPQLSESVQPANPAAAAQSTGPATSPQASTPPQPSMRDQPAALPDQPVAAPESVNTLVVMRGPANIRSAPGKSGRVIGTAAKNATVKELDRSGNWVQVETENGTGWINAVLLGARAPESR